MMTTFFPPQSKSRRRNTMRPIFLLVTALLYTAGAAQDLKAQVTTGMPLSGAVQGYAQSWRIDEGNISKDITQVVVPVGVFAPLAPGVELRVASSYVTLSRRFSDSNEKETLSGLSDLKAQVNASFLENRLHVGVVGNIPTGQSDLSGQEQDVVLSFIAPDLSVRANRFSEGFNLGGSLAYALDFGPSAVATLGGSFISRGPYDYTFPGLTTVVDLNPGFEATATASLLYLMGRSNLRFVTGYTYHGMEQVDGTDAFRLGPRIFGALHYALPIENGKGRVSFSVQEMYRLPHSSGNGVDVESLLDSDGNYLITQGALDYTLTRWLGLALSGTGRLIGKNADGVGDARVIDGSLSAVFTPTPLVDVTIGGRFVVGEGTGLSDEDRNIRGVEALLRVSTRL